MGRISPKPLLPLLLLLSQFAHAQPALVSGLRVQLATARTDTARSRITWQLGTSYTAEQPDSARFFLEQSLRLARQQHDSVATARALCSLAYVSIYQFHDETRALGYIRQALAVARLRRDDYHLAVCYYLMAIIGEHQRDSNTRPLLDTALILAWKVRNQKALGDIFSFKASLTSLAKQPQQVAQHNLRAMHFYWPRYPDKWFTAALDRYEALETQGASGTETRALAALLEARKRQLRQTDGAFVYRNDLARLAIFQKNYAEAETILLKGIADEKSRPHPDTLRLYFYRVTLTDVYVRQRDFEKAYASSTERATFLLWLRQKRQTRETKLQLAELKAALIIQQKEQELETLKFSEQQQRTYLLIALLVSALLVGFVLMLRRNQQHIEQQRTQLAHLNHTKDKLLAILAHDLRSPVGALQNFMVLIDWGLLNKTEFAQQTQLLTGQLGQVSTLLDNVLTWAMTQLDGLRTRPTDVAIWPLVEREIQLIRPAAEAKQLTIETNVPNDLQLFTDSSHLGIIIRNLIHNAVKFTTLGGKITISHKAEPAGHCLYVSDTGTGIPADELPMLFQRGQASQPGTLQETGTGLGLKLIHDLVVANKGTISVESQVGKGTTFRLCFPVV
jgi:signal transduction histidine kinase